MEAAELVQRAQQLVGLAAAMDTDALMRHYADDAVVEFPYRPGREPKRYEGRAAIAAFFEFARDSFSEYTMRAEAIHPGADGATVVVEAAGDGIAAGTGRRYDQRYVLVITFGADGLISSWREYYDPGAVLSAFGESAAR